MNELLRSAAALSLLLPLIAFGADAGAPKGAAADKPAFEMETFQFVILRRPAQPPKLPEKELQRLQREHLAHLTRMHDEGKLLIAGPLSKQPDENLRGLCLYRVTSLDEARKLAEADPMVKAGRLVVDVMNWHVGKGYLAFPRAPGAK